MGLKLNQREISAKCKRVYPVSSTTQKVNLFLQARKPTNCTRMGYELWKTQQSLVACITSQ